MVEMKLQQISRESPKGRYSLVDLSTDGIVGFILEYIKNEV
jgi:hypothetical protein